MKPSSILARVRAACRRGNRLPACVFVGVLPVFSLLVASCGWNGFGTGLGEESVVVYSGRNQKLISPLLEGFQEETGIRVRVRYGDTAELAATILEEGVNSPADVFFAQDAGALGALAAQGRLVRLPPDLMEAVDPRFRSPEGLWVGVTGRARVVAYAPSRVPREDLPESIFDLLDSKWEGRVGWTPTNGSFQSFVTALRKVEGEERTELWLRGMQHNRPRVYPSNLAALRGVASGETDLCLINHYYLHQAQKENAGPLDVANHYLMAGDAGSLINTAGVSLLETSSSKESALKLVRYLLSLEAQRFFAEETFEYPLVRGVPAMEGLVPLAEITPPMLDLAELADLRRTLELMRRSEVLR